MSENTTNKCKDCFWYDLSLKTWLDFECRKDVDNELRVKEIKDRKCKECKENSNYSKKWNCRKCDALIDGHHKMWHDSLCETCYISEIN
jgi:hypothetical protein